MPRRLDYNDPIVILSGGPRSRRVYFLEDAERERAAEIECGREWHYWPTPRVTTIGSVYEFLRKQDWHLTGLAATVWEYRLAPWTGE